MSCSLSLKVFDEEKDPMLLDCAIKSIHAAAHLDCPYIVIHPVIHPPMYMGKTTMNVVE